MVAAEIIIDLKVLHYVERNVTSKWGLICNLGLENRQHYFTYVSVQFYFIITATKCKCGSLYKMETLFYFTPVEEWLPKLKETYLL